MGGARLTADGPYIGSKYIHNCIYVCMYVCISGPCLVCGLA